MEHPYMMLVSVLLGLCALVSLGLLIKYPRQSKYWLAILALSVVAILVISAIFGFEVSFRPGSRPGWINI